MRRRKDSRGQAMVEFAMAVPIFLVLLVAIFDLGHVVWANDALASAAREAARYAIVHGGSASTVCPAGPPLNPATVPPPSIACPDPTGKTAIKDAAADWLIGVGDDPSVSVCYGAVTTCTNDTDAPGATNARGTPITVSIVATVHLAAPSLLGLGPMGLSTTTTMVVSH